MIEKLFILALMFLPFTSIKGLGLLGEVQHEVSAYFLFPALGLAIYPMLKRLGMVAQNKTSAAYVLPKIMFVMLTVIALSFVANFSTINASFFQGRHGLEKYISSTILVLYGFALAFLSYYLAGRMPWDKLIVRPLAISVAICAVFSVFELGALYNGGMSTVYQALSSVVHGGFDPPEWDIRLRSVAFEPPDFANTAGYIWPWLVGAIMASAGRQRTIYVVLFIILNGMIYLSGARTSLVVFSGLVAVFCVLRFVFLPKIPAREPEKYIVPLTIITSLVAGIGFLSVSLNYESIVRAVVTGESISNHSRLASMVAAFRMFEAQPVLGFGFGQFGFHVTHFMPSWGFKSWEIQSWLFSPLGFWPAVYSVYARFAADMGLVGVAMWIGIWLWLARAVLVATLAYRRVRGDIPFAAFPLILSCFCVLLAGVPCDSVRAPMIWVNMGLACRYLYEMREFRQKLVQNRANASQQG